MSYNIGFNNQEILSRTTAFARKIERLQADMTRVFTAATGIQVLVISEFGNMFKKIDQPLKDEFGVTVVEYFQNLIADLQIHSAETIKVVARAPYVALVDTRYWHIIHHQPLELCSMKGMFVHDLQLQSVTTGKLLRCFNCHVPSTGGTSLRKEHTVVHICELMTGTHSSSGVAQPADPNLAWVICGDLNADCGNVAKWCSPFMQKGIPSISYSGHPRDSPAQKADFAVSQGIHLTQVRSFVGIHSAPHATDVHDAVVIQGTMRPLNQETGTVRSMANAVVQAFKNLAARHTVNNAASSGDSHPTVNSLATPGLSSDAPPATMIDPEATAVDIQPSALTSTGDAQPRSAEAPAATTILSEAPTSSGDTRSDHIHNQTRRPYRPRTQQGHQVE